MGAINNQIQENSAAGIILNKGKVLLAIIDKHDINSFLLKQSNEFTYHETPIYSALSYEKGQEEHIT